MKSMVGRMTEPVMTSRSNRARDLRTHSVLFTSDTNRGRRGGS